MIERIIFLLFTLLTISCSKDKSKLDTFLGEEDLEGEMILSYKEGMEALKSGDGLLASKKFNEAEILFPQSIWAAKASLMSAFALY